MKLVEPNETSRHAGAALVTAIFLIAAGPVFSVDTLGSSVGLFVYPSAGQSDEQQQQDDLECYNWAKDQTGYDPVNPGQPQVAETETDRGPDGYRARGALRGAAAGAIVDEAREDHIGHGAQLNEHYGDDHQARQTGAAIGALRGGARSRQARREQEAQTEQQVAASGAAEEEGFKKAMGACLTGRNYSVQY